MLMVFFSGNSHIYMNVDAHSLSAQWFESQDNWTVSCTSVPELEEVFDDQFNFLSANWTFLFVVLQFLCTTNATDLMTSPSMY